MIEGEFDYAGIECAREDPTLIRKKLKKDGAEEFQE